MNKPNRKKILLLLLTLLLLTSFSACGRSESRYPDSIDELDGLRAGAVVGMIHEDVIAEHFPNSPIGFYSTYADELVALETNKADYFVIDAIKAKMMFANTKNIRVFDDNLLTIELGCIFRNDSAEADALRAEVDAFIAKCSEDGTLAALSDKWLEDPYEATENERIEEIELTGENGMLTAAISSTSPPFVFRTGTELNGFDIEFIMLFCREYGYGITFNDSDFNGMIPAVQSGKCDLAISSIAYTAERAANVNFSKPYVVNTMRAVALTGHKDRFSLESLKTSFYNTFVHENRWKMILQGLLSTLEITLFSAVFGSAAGFLIFLACRKGNRILNGFFDGFAWLLGSLPMVVVLMIIYYLVFAESSITGLAVSVIAYSLSLALNVYTLLKTSIKSVDMGQAEGAYSLGFTETQTLYGIILPQAMEQFLPNYMSTLITMLKGTAIVGYIAVQDLTKVSDIIRSRTYEAFFPLIATAAIYVLLVVVITVILRRMIVGFDPKKRSDEKVMRRFRK